MAAKGDDVPKLKDLVYELIKEVDWNELGVQLHVPKHILKNIGKESPTEARKLSEVLQYWLNNGDASWKEIIEALREIGSHENIITNIESKYGILSARGSRGSAQDSSRAASAANTMSDNPPTLPMMLRILLPVSSQWMNIGTMLSLSHERLTAIETRCSGVPDDCLREVLNEWLQQVNPPPTKSALVSAVGAYNQSLAKEISAL